MSSRSEKPKYDAPPQELSEEEEVEYEVMDEEEVSEPATPIPER